MNHTIANSPTAWAARRTVALLLAINMFNYIDRYILAAVVPRIKSELFEPGDMSASFKLGLLSTAFLVAYMIAAPVFGWLADRMSRWLIIGIGVTVWSLASGATGLATTFGMMLAARTLVGLGEAAYGPAAPTIIADLYGVERRGRVLAWLYMAIPVGSAFGYAWGGAADQAGHWRWGFFLTVPPGLLLAAICFLRRDPARGGARNTEIKKIGLAEYKILARTPSYVFTTLGMTAMTFALGGIAIWMPTYVHEFRGVPNLGQVSMIFGGLTVTAGLTATFTGSLLGDKLRPKFPGSYFLVSGVGMLLGLPLFLLVLVTPFPAAWIFIFLAEFCLFLNTAPTNTILANVTHPSIRASGYAMNIMLIHLLGDAISPPLIGLTTGLAGGNMNIGFLPAAAAILLGGIFWLAGTKHLARDMERAAIPPGEREA